MAEPSFDVDSVFAARLQELAAAARTAAQATTNTAAGDWDQPADWSGDPLDIPGLTAAYDRAAIGAAYAQIFADAAAPGPSGAAAALTLQGDQLAADERALRARYATPVRLAVMAAGRRQGHGSPGGVFQQVILRQIQDPLRLAYASPGES